MPTQEKIASLENRLMGIGYVRSPEIMPGYVKPLLMKGEIGVKLEGVITFEGYSEKICTMQIHIPSRNSESRRQLHGYDILFAYQESGDGWWYVRSFPYAEVLTCLGRTRDTSRCILPLSDENAVIETIEREVNFTRRMIESSDMTAVLEGPPLRIPTEGLQLKTPSEDSRLKA